ncbi:enhancer of mRNA decapping [Microbotryomycetes sp. JL201]|nr:enhancer of mRNA decapping [Microbotryomycetes sp. JL201]
MAASFVGLPVSCRLRTGATIQGTVTALDVQQGTISLADTVVTFGGSASQAGSRHVGDWTVNRNDIVELQVVSVPSRQDTAGSGQETQQRASEDQSSADTPVAKQFQQQADATSSKAQGHATSTSTPSPSRVRTTPKAKHKHVAVQESSDAYTSDDHSQKKNRRKKKTANDAKAPTAASSLEQEFDFGAGLRSFDKKAVFEQIRSQDQTDPASRLVSHNKRHAHNPYMSKLASNESVLSERELQDQQQDTAQALEALSLKRDNELVDSQTTSEVETEDEEFTTGTESQSEQAGPDSAMTESDSDFDVVVDRRPYLSSRRSTIKPGQEYNEMRQEVTGASLSFRTDEDVRCSAISLKQFREALSIADIETGPTLIQRSEVAGLGIALFVLRHLSLDVGQSPEVCILCGESEKAETALRTGVMLLNRGGRVTALMPKSTAAPTPELREGLRVVRPQGVATRPCTADIYYMTKTTSLVIDALYPCVSASTKAPTTSVDSELFSYLAGQDAPAILSIDSAAGIDHDTGLELQHHTVHAGQSTKSIAPTYIVCRGSLRQGAARMFHEQRQVAQSEKRLNQIVLVDLGMSPVVWKRLGVDWQPETFGSECLKVLTAE